MVWVAAADRQRVFNEIVAFKPPVKEGEDTMITTFRQHQTRKMMHDCGRRGQASFCRPEGHTDVCCKRGFPFNPHLEDAYEDVNARRWVYYRPPGGEHAWVASTIPAALLSWIGHANVQIATTDQLTDYMLKYEIKAEALGVLNLTCQTVEALGITGLTDHQRAFLSAALYTRPVCLSEAALHMLQIPVVQLSVTVDYYDTHPPRLGVRTMSRDGAPMYVPPVRIYEQRPPALEGLSFAEAMSQYERLQAATVRGRPPHVGAGSSDVPPVSQNSDTCHLRKRRWLLLVPSAGEVRRSIHQRQPGIQAGDVLLQPASAARALPERDVAPSARADIFRGMQSSWPGDDLRPARGRNPESVGAARTSPR
jgi:hypothetical protein